jgi:hypothetical protein
LVQLVFRGGRNIALQVLPHRSGRTVAFGRAVHRVTWCPEIERLADGFRITDWAGIGHAIAHPAEDPGS